jgi:hypothetical protein
VLGTTKPSNLNLLQQLAALSHEERHRLLEQLATTVMLARPDVDPLRSAPAVEKTQDVLKIIASGSAVGGDSGNAGTSLG